MKSYILAAICFIPISAFGQLSKTTWLVGGSGSLYSYNESYSSPATNFSAKYTNIDISASLGYFPFDKFAAGLRPMYSSFKGKVINGGKTNSFQIAVGPFLRYYFLDDENSFNFLTDVSYLFGMNKYLGVLREKGKFNTFNVMCGSEVFFNTTAGIEILIGYSKKIVSINNSPGEFKSTKSGVLVSIGLQFHLQKN